MVVTGPGLMGICLSIVVTMARGVEPPGGGSTPQSRFHSYGAEAASLQSKGAIVLGVNVP
ncbi:MAG: hypothetical protein LBD40_00955 [Puniceicoccales bacterium]|nr:hypothetical protein [Puniceicoccales bacterium]